MSSGAKHFFFAAFHILVDAVQNANEALIIADFRAREKAYLGMLQAYVLAVI